MKTFAVTDKEFAILAHAVEVFNDMQNDMTLEEITANLYPRGDEVTTINENQAKVLRDEINEAIDNACARRTLMTKLGLKFNDKGYSV